MFGNTAADQSFEVKCLEQLVCLVYGQQGLSTVGTARWALFSKKGYEAEKLPPTKGALIPHIYRARFFTIIARGYSTAEPIVPVITECGWEEKDGKIIPEKCLELPAPKGMVEFVKC